MDHLLRGHAVAGGSGRGGDAGPGHRLLHRDGDNVPAQARSSSAALAAVGLRPLTPAGTYFIIADTAAFPFPDDFAFCRWLTSAIGVAAIPPGAFYSEPHRHLARYLARFCFCKTDETLDAAAKRLSVISIQ